jgi:hypothetical protein
MKAREIRERLKGKIDPEVLTCLCAMAESLSSQQQEISMLASTIDRLADILMQLGATIESATNTVDEMKKMRNN